MTRSTLDRTLADLLVQERAVPLAAHLVGLGIVTLLVAEAMPPAAFGIWAGAVVVVIGARAALWGCARRLPSPRAAVRTVWATMGALGLAWGVGTAVAAQYVAPAAFAFLLLALAGLMAGGIATLSADRWAYPLYSAAMFGPVLVGVASGLSGRLEGIAIALIMVFVVFTVRLHRQAHEMLYERLQIEAELRNHERQLDAAQAIAHVGSWEWDMTTNVVTWSEELRRMYGVPPDAPAGYAEFLALSHPDDRERLQALVAEGVRTRRSIDYEWRIVRADGEVRHIQGRNVVIVDAAGQAIRMAGTSLDITNRKRADENQRTLLLELQKAVAEVKTLEGILPICASCKRIRGENGGWEAVEVFVRDHTNAEFSHGLCPDCAARDWGT